jgi:hypothetical protein
LDLDIACQYHIGTNIGHPLIFIIHFWVLVKVNAQVIFVIFLSQELKGNALHNKVKC